MTSHVHIYQCISTYKSAVVDAATCQTELISMRAPAEGCHSCIKTFHTFWSDLNHIRTLLELCHSNTVLYCVIQWISSLTFSTALLPPLCFTCMSLLTVRLYSTLCLCTAQPLGVCVCVFFQWRNHSETMVGQISHRGKHMEPLGVLIHQAVCRHTERLWSHN